MRTKFQLYTVPGQVYYNATRKLVLRGADGVIFVADSNADKMKENIESIDNLVANLKEHGIDIADIPLVFQWNKRDLPNAVAVEELQKNLNRWNAPAFTAVAIKGEGVFATLKCISGLVLDKISRKLPRGAGAAVRPTAPAPAAAPPQAAAAPAAPAPAARPVAAPAPPVTPPPQPSVAPAPVAQAPQPSVSAAPSAAARVAPAAPPVSQPPAQKVSPPPRATPVATAAPKAAPAAPAARPTAKPVAKPAVPQARPARAGVAGPVRTPGGAKPAQGFKLPEKGLSWIIFAVIIAVLVGAILLLLLM
jgi:hypothetical protein